MSGSQETRVPQHLVVRKPIKVAEMAARKPKEFTLAQVAEFLGAPIECLRYDVRLGRLPAVKRWRTYYVTESDLREYVGNLDVGERDMELRETAAMITNFYLNHAEDASG